MILFFRLKQTRKAGGMWSFGVFRIGSRKAVYSDYILFSVCFYSADNFGNKRISAQNSIYKDRNRKNAGKRTKVLEKEKKKTMVKFIFPLYINCRRSKRGNGTPTNSDSFREFEKGKSPERNLRQEKIFRFFFCL